MYQNFANCHKILVFLDKMLLNIDVFGLNLSKKCEISYIEEDGKLKTVIEALLKALNKALYNVNCV